MTQAALDHPQACAKAAPAPDAVAEHQTRARLQHLFRHTLQARLINPLMHIVTRHRLASTP
jgi:hypothetical protein